MTPPSRRRPMRNWAICLEYKTGPKQLLIQQLPYCMTLFLFTVFAGKTWSAVSLLRQDYYANLSGDPFSGDTPHDSFMRSVFFHLK